MAKNIHNIKIAPQNLIYSCAFPYTIQPYPTKGKPPLLGKGLSILSQMDTFSAFYPLDTL